MPIKMKGAKNRRAKVFDLIVGVSPSASFKEFREPTTKENLKEHLLSMEDRSKTRRLLNSLKDIMEMDEEDFHELHEGKPGFNYRNYKNVRQPALGFFNELMSEIARPEGEKRDKISPNLLSAIEKFKAGDDSALMPMLEKGTERFKNQLRQVIDDEFYAAAKQSENNERLVELLANVDSEFARKAKAEKTDYTPKDPLTPHDVINYLETGFKVKKFERFIAPSRKDNMDGTDFTSLFGGVGRARVPATLQAFIRTDNIDTFPISGGSKAVGEGRIQSILQEADRETETEDVVDVAEVGAKDIPSVLEDYRKSQVYGGRDDNVRNRLLTFRNALVKKGKTDDVKHLDAIIEAGQYYLTEQEYSELADGEKGTDVKGNQVNDWHLRRRFSHLLDGDELKPGASDLLDDIEDDLVGFQRGKVTTDAGETDRTRDDPRKPESKPSSSFFVVDLTGSKEELQSRLDRMKKLFSQSVEEGVDALLTSFDVGRKEGAKNQFQTLWRPEAKKLAVGNTVTYEGLVSLLISIEEIYGTGDGAIYDRTKKYINSGEESDEDNLEIVLKRDYPKIRELFFSYVSSAIEKIANLTDDDENVKDNPKMKTFRGYVRTNLVN
jgi:hypothetical protein